MQALLGGPRAGLLAADVREALAFTRGAKVRRGVDVLDRQDRLTGEVLPFTGGQVSWSYRPPSATSGQDAGTTAVRRQAALELAGAVTVNLSARRLRFWTELLLRDGRWARFHQGVFEAASPGVTDDGQVVRRSLQLAGKSHRWATTTLTAPVTYPGSTVAVAEVISRLTTRFGEQAFAIEQSSATIGQPRTFEAGASELAVCSSLLASIGYDQLTDDEEGRPSSRPLSKLATLGPETVYAAGRGKVLTAGSVDPLLPDLPNVVRFSARQGPSLGNVEGNGLATRRNQSTGPASIDARGGTGVGEVELLVQVDADSQAVLEQIADAEKQTYFAGGGERFRGQVGLNPLAGERDVVDIVLPRLGMTSGPWLVTDWSVPHTPVTSAADVLMTITAERRVA